MTTAARLAAHLQLRSSNIPVAPLDAPGVHPGRYLVVYRAGPEAKFFGRHAPTVLFTEQHDLISNLDRPVRPEDAGVHRDPPQEGSPLAPDQGLRPTRKIPPVSFGLPDRHRRREHRLFGPEGQPVGYPIARLQPPHDGDVALESHRWPESLFCRVSLISCRVEAVERHAGTDAVVMRSGIPEGGRGVRGVHQRAAEWLGCEDGLEGLHLAPRRLFVAVGGGEVG